MGKLAKIPNKSPRYFVAQSKTKKMSQVQLINLTITDLKCLISDVIRGEFPANLQQTSESYLTREDVCRLLSVDASTLWRWNKSSYLKPIKVGGLVRYKQSDILKLMEAGQ